MYKNVSCLEGAPNSVTNAFFASSLHLAIQTFRARFPTDQLFIPDNWAAAMACAHQILKDIQPQDIQIGLGNSISWILQIVKMTTHDHVDPIYMAFSGKNPQLVSLDTIQNVDLNELPKPKEWGLFMQYMSHIHCTPTQWLAHNGQIRIVEYSESGRGILSFLGTLHHFALDVGIEPRVLFDKIECVLFRPQKSIKKYGASFPNFPCTQITYTLPHIDACLDQLCNDDTVRLVPSFNWFKLNGPFPSALFERSADAEIKRSLLRMLCLNNA